MKPVLYLIISIIFALGQYFVTGLPGRWAILPIFITLIAMDVVITKLRINRHES